MANLAARVMRFVDVILCFPARCATRDALLEPPVQKSSGSARQNETVGEMAARGCRELLDARRVTLVHCEHS
jgi:hypothetical protein